MLLSIPLKIEKKTLVEIGAEPDKLIDVAVFNRLAARTQIFKKELHLTGIMKQSIAYMLTELIIRKSKFEHEIFGKRR